MTANLDFHKKRKRVVRSSLTKLSTKLTELEADYRSPACKEPGRNAEDFAAGSQELPTSHY